MVRYSVSYMGPDQPPEEWEASDMLLLEWGVALVDETGTPLLVLNASVIRKIERKPQTH